MEAEPQQSREQEDAISASDAAIEALNLAEKNSSIAPIGTVFATVDFLLVMTKGCSRSSAMIYSRLTPS